MLVRLSNCCSAVCTATCKIWWFDGWFWWLKIINHSQNDFKIKITNKYWFKIKIINHSDWLKSRFKIIWFEIIPNTAREMVATIWQKFHNPDFNRFSMIHSPDRQTDGRAISYTGMLLCVKTWWPRRVCNLFWNESMCGSVMTLVNDVLCL